MCSTNTFSVFVWFFPWLRRNLPSRRPLGSKPVPQAQCHAPSRCHTIKPPIIPWGANKGMGAVPPLLFCGLFDDQKNFKPPVVSKSSSSSGTGAWPEITKGPAQWLHSGLSSKSPHPPIASLGKWVSWLSKTSHWGKKLSPTLLLPYWSLCPPWSSKCVRAAWPELEEAFIFVFYWLNAATLDSISNKIQDT